MKLDNNIYDNNTVFDTNEKEIFNGNFKELKEFMLNTFNFKLTDDEDMEAYEDFNGHEFKIQMGIHIDQEFLNQLEATARAEAKLEEIYNKVFGKFSIKEMLEMIKSKEILNYMNQYMNEIPTSFENPHEANYFIFETVDDFIEEMLAQLYYKYKETGIMISFCPDTNINFDASRVVPTANENRPLNMSVVVLIKAKDVISPSAGQIDKTIVATEAKAGVVKLKNSITAQQEDAAVTEKAVSDLFSQIDLKCVVRVTFSGQGSVSIIDSKNISSIVKNGVGDYTIKFLKPMEDTNYYIFTSLEPFNTAGPNHVAHPQYQGIKRDSLRIITGYGATSFSDEARVQVMIFIK